MIRLDDHKGLGALHLHPRIFVARTADYSRYSSVLYSMIMN